MMMAPRARVKLPAQLDRLTTDQLVTLIKQSRLGREDEKIATAYLIDVLPMVDVGAEMGMSRSGVSRRMRGIIAKLMRMEKEQTILH